LKLLSPTFEMENFE